MAAPGGAGVLDASWTAPTTNVDASPLTDLASYRVYYGVSDPPCPESSFFQVASPTPSPPDNQTVTFRLTGLATSALYYVSVTAVNTSGLESACSPTASAVARLDFAVSPTGTVNFGSVNLGSFADQTFTVSNLEPAMGGGTVSGTASTPAPFSIVSGSPFTLGVGASQAMTVRFTPTTSAAVTANVNFTADGDTLSRIVTGSGTFVLTVSTAGAGAGTVTSSPAGIDCGATCTASFESGTGVTLTATPSANSAFTGWSDGGCTGTGTCVVTVSAATAVTATFTPTFVLTGSTSGSGTVTSSPTGISCPGTCSKSYNAGTVVTFSPAPSVGFVFAGWSGDCSGTGTCQVTIAAAHSVKATFASVVTLTVSTSGPVSGTITSSPARISCPVTCSAAFVSGTLVTLTATPPAGATFAGWSGACTGAGACQVMMSAAQAVTAIFAVPLTDPPVAAGATIRAVDIAVLRIAVNALRAQRSLGAFTFTDPTLAAGISTAKTAHITELRIALNEVYVAKGRTPPTYTDPTLVPGTTPIKAVHINDLQAAVNAF